MTTTPITSDEQIDSEQDMTLNFAQPYIIGGGGDDFGQSFSCHIGL